MVWTIADDNKIFIGILEKASTIKSIFYKKNQSRRGLGIKG
jgi:hypothetical protein